MWVRRNLFHSLSFFVINKKPVTIKHSTIQYTPSSLCMFTWGEMIDTFFNRQKKILMPYNYMYISVQRDKQGSVHCPFRTFLFP